MKTILQWIDFLKNVANDSRIPSQDKKILLALIALVMSPVDLIPDWVPVLGVLDDFVIVSLILDYFFSHLDDAILLSHYPWSMKSFVRLKKVARAVSFFAPRWFKDRVWSFKPDVYQ